MKRELFVYSGYPEWGKKKLNGLFYDDEIKTLFIGKLFDSANISFDIYSSLNRLSLAVVFVKSTQEKLEIFYYSKPEDESSKQIIIKIKDIENCIIDESLLGIDGFSIWNGFVFERNHTRFSLNGKTPEILDIRATEPFIKSLIEKYKYVTFNINCFENAFGTKTVLVGGTDEEVLGNDYIGEIPNLKTIFVFDADPDVFWPYMETDFMKLKNISIYAIGKDKNEDFSNWKTFSENGYGFKLMGEAYYEADETGKITRDLRNGQN